MESIQINIGQFINIYTCWTIHFTFCICIIFIKKFIKTFAIWAIGLNFFWWRC